MLMWLARCALPFNCIDAPECKKLFAHHNVSLRSSDHIRRVVLPAVATHVRELVRKRLQSAPAAAVVIDGWDLRMEKVVGIVLHRVSDDWQLRSEVVGLMQVEGSHTGEALAAAVSARVEAFLDKRTAVAAAVSDNGPNYTKACDKIAGGEHWPCVLHTLQLVIRAVIGNDGVGRPKQLVQLVHDIVKKVRADSEIRAELAEEQRKRNLPVLQLVTDNDTRWHSELAMLERFLAVFDALAAVLARHDYRLKDDDKRDVQALTEVLGSLRKHCRALETEAIVTLSLVLPHLHKIRSRVLAYDGDDSPVKANFKVALLAQFDERFEGILCLHPLRSLTVLRAALFLDVSLPSVASALDPRTGGLKMLTPEARDLTWQAIATEAESVLVASTEEDEAAGVVSLDADLLVCFFASCTFSRTAAQLSEKSARRPGEGAAGDEGRSFALVEQADVVPASVSLRTHGAGGACVQYVCRAAFL